MSDLGLPPDLEDSVHGCGIRFAAVVGLIFGLGLLVTCLPDLVSGHAGFVPQVVIGLILSGLNAVLLMQPWRLLQLWEWWRDHFRGD